MIHPAHKRWVTHHHNPSQGREDSHNGGTVAYVAYVSDAHVVVAVCKVAVSSGHAIMSYG
jgi:hypothetical protein